MRQEHMQSIDTRQGPVFVVGFNGSGTTMLADSLGNHPDLFMFPEETKVLPHFISKASRHYDLTEFANRRKLANELGRCWAYWEVNGRKPVILDDDDLLHPHFSDVVNGLYSYFAASSGKSRWGDKTPMYIQHIALLAQNIPGSQFIHIYRDGRDVAQSLHRRWNREPRRSIYRWKRILGLGRSQGNTLGPTNYFEISYEALTAYPERNMKAACDFLNLDYHPDVLKSSMPYLRNSVSENRKGFIVENSEKWRTYFTKKEIQELEIIAGQLLVELGYEPYVSTGNYDPTRSHLLWWKLNDQLWQTCDFFRRRGLRATGRFIRRAIINIIQERTQQL